MKFIMGGGPFQSGPRPFPLVGVYVVVGPPNMKTESITRVAARRTLFLSTPRAPLSKFEITLANFAMQIARHLVGVASTLFATINFRFNWIGLL